MSDSTTKPPALMVQGCTSDAGKSVLVAGLCRLLHRRGVRVAPFKPQNMALNSAVTVDGGEIGRAQALQAQAAGLAPHSDFNPVLLKPTSDRAAQVILNGRVAADLDARAYHLYKPRAMQAVLASWERLARQYDCLVVEGAGSPAEGRPQRRRALGGRPHPRHLPARPLRPAAGAEGIARLGRPWASRPLRPCRDPRAGPRAAGRCAGGASRRRLAGSNVRRGHAGFSR